VSLAARAGEILRPALDRALARLDPVTLEQLDRAQLHERVETKAVMRAEAVPDLLRRLRGQYHVMEHAGTRLQRYTNAYFDTADLRDYRAHHNRRRHRSKIRYRSYVDSDLTFFEIKRKDGARTVKLRQVSTPARSSLWPDDGAFLARVNHDPSSAYVPSLAVSYRRILLVRRDFGERVTIDLDLCFDTGARRIVMPDAAIVEFKQPRLDRRSPAVRAVPRPAQRFSKYCIGLASCDPSLKQNRFKRVFRGLAKIGAHPVMAARPATAGRTA